MINIKNIAKVLLIALFVCVWGGDVSAELVKITAENATQYGYDPKNLPSAGVMYDTNTNTSVKPSDDAGTDASKQEQPDKVDGQGGVNTADFCSGDFGLFSDLVKTGQLIFNRLRDLIYVVAGFGIIAVAVGGFFGNLNWKWLGAIVISLVVIATAGELIVLMTGCETFGSSLITNTLSNSAPTMSTEDYNKAAMDENSGGAGGRIQWDDSMDKSSDWTGMSAGQGDQTTGAAPGEEVLPSQE